MAKLHVKKGDRVKVIAGKDKGKEGEVIRAYPKKGRVVVEKVNIIKKAMRPTQQNPQGGITSMEAAIEGLTRPDGSRPLLIAVTQLTSTDQSIMESELLIEKPLEDVVIAYAQNAASSGLDGVVCSPLEAGRVHDACGAGFLTVTPGVRFADSSAGDQKRVTTPRKARELGADYIVVGRPITQADDPTAAYRKCVKEFLE